ncbi:hypothetical protein [Actinoplanes teichomyceticus]|uniref:DinB family protein n=1 Tax=Actinoplanes teichomyceticus TaxID=1867 RepID=A0A561WLR2_ACTTI|nr:hypothetical protein [Actinoplanes teichomyceticus]TWG24802.1 hypothetical protein FHX34_1021365 [Actinoplanes teichomyceticus]GIF15665.1 hypothetical protein Ate01nite_56970 [Actinoplanes teichomyceticus]
MQTEKLAVAYRELVRVAGELPFDALPTDADRAATAWRLAHIALSDRALVGTAHAVIAGTPAVIDNAPAMSGPAIDTILSSTSHLERVDMVRRNAAELIDLLAGTPQELASTPVHARLVDRAGQVVLEDDIPWSAVIDLRAEQHIPGHTAALAHVPSRSQG